MQDLHQAYRTFFGKGDALYQLFSPYRICPLGAHVDHQHGLVSGFAFDNGIDFLFSATDTGKVEMASLSFEGLMTFNVQKPVDEKQNNWGDYLRGAVWALQQDYHLEKGVRGIVKGSMPVGGVSSSAALLCGFVMAIAKVNNISLDKMHVISYASKAEREYVGLRMVYWIRPAWCCVSQTNCCILTQRHQSMNLFLLVAAMCRCRSK